MGKREVKQERGDARAVCDARGHAVSARPEEGDVEMCMRCGQWHIAAGGATRCITPAEAARAARGEWTAVA